MFHHPKTRHFAANQTCLFTAIQCIEMTSCKQRLITKERIATHTNLFLWFNPRYFSDKKLYYIGILTVTLQASLSL